MSFIELLLTAAALSMDAFAVAICKGLELPKIKLKQALIIGLYFGAFQALMPIAGFYIASSFEQLVKSFDHWIAFGLLVLIGVNMIRESFSKNDEKQSGGLKPLKMLVLAVATSIDALVVGIALAMSKTDNSANIFVQAATIGVVTLLLSMLGAKIGNVFGTKYKSKAELAGGVVLILIGTKTLLEHLGIINF